MLAKCYSPLSVPIAFLEFLNVFTLRSSERKGVSSSRLQRIRSIWEEDIDPKLPKLFLRKGKFKLEPHTELLTAGVPMKSMKLLSRYIPYGTDRSQEQLCQVGAESGAIPGGIAPLGMRQHI